jgi:hypothetical protein
MDATELSLLQRIALAFVAFFLILFRRDFALRVAQARAELKALPPTVPRRDRPQGARAAEPALVALAPERALGEERTAVQVLSLLQREGRFVDFVEEDLGEFSDAQVGAAARMVHEGCKRAIAGHFRLEPVYREPEGAAVTVGPGFDPSAVRLSGNVVGAPPFRGSLRHHGWKAREVTLPPLPDGLDPAIVAPAEVEL